MYQMLNDDLFGNGFLKDFYYSDISQIEETESLYQNVIQELDGGEFLLDIEDLYHIFPRISLYRISSQEDTLECASMLYGTPFDSIRAFGVSLTEGQENYVFLCNNGRGKTKLTVTERNGDEFKTINEFEIPSDRKGEVVRYENEFYYIFLYNNFNQKDCDGIGLCPLGDNPEKDIFPIWYLPYAYVWEKLSASDEESEMSGQMDAANCGLPVYVWREHALSYITEKPEYLRVCFYFYDSLTDSYVELPQLSMDEQGEDLVQMWFKEIEGKVYTFRLYYVSDYSYMLDVSLLEKNQLKAIRRYLLLPPETVCPGNREWIGQ